VVSAEPQKDNEVESPPKMNGFFDLNKLNHHLIGFDHQKNGGIDHDDDSNSSLLESSNFDLK